MNFLLFLIAVFGNLWLWRILNSNIWLGIVLIVFSYLLIKAIEGKKFNFILVSLFFVVLLFQWETTVVRDLVSLNNDEQRLQQQRLKEYPPVKISLGGKTLWIPIAHWFEGRRESIAFSRIKQNLFEDLDLNLYFFAGHPRERIGFKEFEKFSYVLLPFFILGIFNLVKNKKYSLIPFFVFPLALLAIIGNNNQVGPFSVFPFITAGIYKGSDTFYKYVSGFSFKQRALILIVVFLVFLLSMLQIISYSRFK
jgi:hypothetical protein